MKEKVKKLPNNAFMISPNKAKGIYYAHLNESDIPEGSQPYFIEWLSKWMHIVIERTTEQGEIKYEKYDPKDVIVQTPGDLLEALSLPANASYWAVSKSMLEKLAIGMVVAVILGGMILMFAMSSGKTVEPSAMIILQAVML